MGIEHRCAILREAEKRAGVSQRSIAEEAVDLALAGWKPPPKPTPADRITVECRKIVADYYDGVKRDAGTALAFRNGQRDGMAEMAQAKNAMRAGINICAEWVERNAPGSGDHLRAALGV